MARIRLEWVRSGRPDFQRGDTSGDLAIFYAEQTIIVASTAIRSSAAPAFIGKDGATGTEGMARVTVLSGAVAVAWGGATPTATETTGVRLEAGQTQLFAIDTGEALSFIEAVDGPAAKAVQDAASETSLIAIQAAVQAPLSVLASPIHATATPRSGVLTAANTAQDLMPANAARNGWTIQNQSTGNLYVRSKGSAGTALATLDQNSLIIPPGAAYDPPRITIHALSITGASAGQTFFAEEW